MFGRNTYHIPQVSHSSLNSRDSASVIDFNEADLFHHQHHHLLSGSYLTGNPLVNEAASSFSHDSGGGGINGVPNSCPSKQAVKKDRHSKIYTSQGPRDRRVRLSIGIARKFFDLQEMLGVDKPSKTLDWLLTKSKTAIKDLVHTKQNTDKNDVSSSTAENNGETLENGKSVGKRKSAGKQKGGGGGGAKDPQVNLAKESRAKARARARERTREKMCIKQQQKQQLQQCMNNQLEICKISGTGSGSNHNNNGFCLSAYEEANHQDMIQESIVIKRKVKHPSPILGFQQSCIISRDLNSGIPSSFPTSENWDANSFNPQANIYAIWDQHRFINSASNN